MRVNTDKLFDCKSNRERLTTVIERNEGGLKGLELSLKSGRTMAL